MGDIAMTVPIVYSLAKQYPDVRISVLSRPFAQPFFQHLAPNVDFMAADLKEEYKGFRGLNALYRCSRFQYRASNPFPSLTFPSRGQSCGTYK